MVAAPDKSRVIAGGSFSTINGQDAYGMGSIDATTGATLPWAANVRLRAAGLNGAIEGMSTDGISDLRRRATPTDTGAAFEGTFSADPTTGAINWVNDCLGDTYDIYPMGGALYTVSHDHNCTMAGAFRDTSPRARWQKATAERIGPPIGDDHQQGRLQLGLHRPALHRACCTGTPTWNSAATPPRGRQPGRSVATATTWCSPVSSPR